MLFQFVGVRVHRILMWCHLTHRPMKGGSEEIVGHNVGKQRCGLTRSEAVQNMQSHANFTSVVRW